MSFRDLLRIKWQWEIERFSCRYFGFPFSATSSQCAMLIFNSSSKWRHIILVTDSVVKHTNSLHWTPRIAVTSRRSTIENGETVTTVGLIPRIPLERTSQQWASFQGFHWRERHNSGPHSKDSTGENVTTVGLIPRIPRALFTSSITNYLWARGGTTPQTGRSRVRFPTVSLEFFNDIIVPVTLWP